MDCFATSELRLDSPMFFLFLSGLRQHEQAVLTRDMFRGFVSPSWPEAVARYESVFASPADCAVYCKSEQLPEFIHCFVHITGTGAIYLVMSLPEADLAYTDSLPVMGAGSGCFSSTSKGSL